MGTNYSYTLAVERNDALLINGTQTPLPRGVSASNDGHLTWAVDQFRTTLASLQSQDPEAILHITFKDQRGERTKTYKATFTNPDEVTLPNLRKKQVRRARRHETVAAPSTAPAHTGSTSASASQSSPEPQASAPASDPELRQSIQQAMQSVEDQQAIEPDEDDEDDEDYSPAGSRRRWDPDLVTTELGTPNDATKDNHQWGWVEVPREEAERPSTEPGRRTAQSREKIVQGAKNKANEYRKPLWWAAGILAVLLIIAGLRVFGMGGTYQAVCVDQRTMTRVSSASICNDSNDTNHRWWYTKKKADDLPDPGDSVNMSDGNFQQPREGAKVEKRM